MTRRAARIHGLGRRFGDRRRRDDHRRRLGDANRLQARGRAGARRWPRGLAGFGGLAALPLGVGGRNRLDQARQDAPGRARRRGRGRRRPAEGAARRSRAAPFAADFCGSSAQEGAGSPGGRRCRRTSTTNERGGRFMAATTSADFADRPGHARRESRPDSPGRGPHAEDRGAKNASRVNGGERLC